MIYDDKKGQRSARIKPLYSITTDIFLNFRVKFLKFSNLGSVVKNSNKNDNNDD